MKTDKASNGGEFALYVEILRSREIKTNDEFLVWAQGTLQKFLPHEVLIAAWGDFSLGIIYYEIISDIPGVRTKLMRAKEMAALLKRLYAFWISQGRVPSQLSADGSVVRCRDIVDKPLKFSMQRLKTALVHAIKDVRGGSDSFYVLLSSNADISPEKRNAFHQLLPYIDATLRQIEHFPVHAIGDEPSESAANKTLTIKNVLNLSDRESEIMGWVCSGKTNDEIGSILDISTFTVKNHLQRIFKKIDVVNRSQAVAKILNQVT